MIGLRIVFAICDVALGYKIRLSYICLTVPLSLASIADSSIASATPFSAYLPFKGLVIPASTVLLGSISILFILPPNALNASNSVS